MCPDVYSRLFLANKLLNTNTQTDISSLFINEIWSNKSEAKAKAVYNKCMVRNFWTNGEIWPENWKTINHKHTKLKILFPVFKSKLINNPLLFLLFYRRRLIEVCPLFKGHPRERQNMVFRDKWSLFGGYFFILSRKGYWSQT